MKHLLITPLLVSVVAGLVSAQEAHRKAAQDPAVLEAGTRGAARSKASMLIGCDITNSKDESLGEIQDIVLDAGSHRIAYAVVGFGGFLGMGEKYFAMPWRLIEVSQPTADGKPIAKLGLDKETLKAAPGFDKGMWPDMANASWTKQVDDYYSSTGKKAQDESGTPPLGSGVDGKRGVDHSSSSKAFAHRRLGNLIGMDVVDPQHRKLADVEDLVIDTKFATVDGALLSFGGTLGMGEKLVLVTTDALTIDQEKGVFVFAGTTQNLETMALPGGKLPALNNDKWVTDCRAACAKAHAEATTATGDVVPVDASGKKAIRFVDTYDLNKVETVKGTITTIGSVSVGERNEERVRLRIRTDEGREVVVYAAPASFADQAAMGLRNGTKIEVTGSPAMHGTKTVLVAGSLQVDGKSLKLRDDQGSVVWTKK